MSALARFGVAFNELEATAVGVLELLPSRLATAATLALDGVDAAGLSLMTDELRVPVGSSDTTAELAQQLQFTAGEGPCITAHESGQPVTADQTTLSKRWPRFTRRLLAQTPYHAVLSVPLPDGMAGLGTLDVYFQRSIGPADMPTEQTKLIATLISAALAREQFDVTTAEDRTSSPAWLDNPSTARRFLVPIASGMVTAHTGQGFPDTLALLRARATANNTTVDDLAADIVQGILPVDALTH